MIYLYDNAIVSDLEHSFNPKSVPNPVVRVVAPEQVVGLAAQIQNDEISFPLVAVTRGEDTPIDSALWNFTRAHKGVQAVLDPKTNELYYEKAIPIKLSYALTILATNTADIDELIRELIFKYTSQYYLTITLPYECKRKVRFGVVVDTTTDIQRSSGSTEYLESGKLYQAIIPLVCEGCVLVTYTPAKLRRTVYEIEPTLQSPQTS